MDIQITLLIQGLTLTIIVVVLGRCYGLIEGERQHRKAVLEEMRDERHVLKDALRQISEAHNTLTTVQKLQGESLEDLVQRVAFLVQGIKK